MKIDFSIKYYSVFILLLALTIANFSVKAQIDPDFLWVQNLGGLDDDQANDIRVDGEGNIIVTGTFWGTVTFGTTTLNSSGLADIFIVKFNPLGNVLWAIKAGGTDYDEGLAVTTDNSNNIIVTGSFSGDAFFGSTVLTSSGGTDVFTAKYSSAGVLIWAKKGGGSSFDAGYSATADNNGNIYITGVFLRTIIFDQLSIQGGEYLNIFLVKYDPNGNALWLNAGISNGFYNYGYGVATNSLNDVFITGMFGEQTNFSGTILTSVAGPDIFLARYDTNGNLIWIRQAGGTSFNEAGYDLTITDDNDIYLTGGFGETINFGGIPPLTSTGNSNAFVAKYNLAGTPQWAVIAGDSLNTFGQSIDIDDAGNLFVAGTIGEVEQERIYLLKMRNNGQSIWEFSAGGDQSNRSGGLALNRNGEAYTTGSFYASGSFGSLILTSNGFEDAFVGKLPTPQLNLITPIINFGSVAVGSTSNLNISLSNPSTTRLGVYSVTLAGPNANEFSLIGSIQSILPQQSLNLNLTFSPASAGIKNAIVIIESEATSTPDTVLISGTGGSVSISLSSNILDFGSLDVNNSAELILTISNTGTQVVSISDIQISGPNANEFGLIGQLQDSIPVSDSRNIRVIYTPSSPGSKIAQLSVISNAPSSPDIVELIGNAITAIVVELPGTPSLGQTTNLNVTPPEGFNVTSNLFHYRRTGESQFQQALMTLSGSTYIASVSPAFSTVRGIQYYIEFSNSDTTVTFPSVNPIENPATIQVNIERLDFPEIITASSYRMVSAPLLLNNTNISSVLTDDYGNYDNKIWRFFHWDPLLEEYIEFPDITKDFSPGQAFWLIHRDGNTFDFENAVSVPSLNDFNLIIQPGWNQIATPFAFPIDWFSVENSSSLQEPVRWLPDSSEYEYDQTILEPWEGYWVFNSLSQSVNISFPPIESNGNRPFNNKYNFAEGEFYLQIKTSLENSLYKDNQNFVGMINPENISSIKNLLEAPPITDHIRLSIVENNKLFARLVSESNENGASWNLIIKTIHRNKNIIINFDELSLIPKEFRLWLLDLNKQKSIPVSNNIAIINSGSEEQINLQLIVGTEEFAQQKAGNISLTPTDYVLYQNYPNPFNPSTIIEYNLREKSIVTIDIFDVLGRRVATIIDSDVQSSGKHSVSWDGRNLTGNFVSSGVYIYQLRANDFILSKKMILVR